MTKHCELNQKITIQQESRVADSAGGNTRTWENIASDPTPFAKVKATGSTSETFDYERVNAESGYEFTVHNRSDIDETMSIVWNSRRFNIRNVMYDGPLSKFLVIQTDKGAAV